MKIAQLAWTPFALPLRQPIATGAGTALNLLHERRGVLIQLTTDAGVIGYGEASPLPHFGTETFEEIEPTLENVAELLRNDPTLLGDAFCKESSDGIAEALDALAAKLRAKATVAGSAHGFRCTFGAIELALRDAWAKTRGCTLAEDLARELRGEQSSRSALRDREEKKRSEPAKADESNASGSLACTQVPVNALLTKESVSEITDEAETAVAAGYTTLKIKLGAKSLGEDLARIDSVRRSVGKNIKIRLDANAAWSFSSALRALEALASRDIEFLEQPVAANNIAELAALRAKKLVPIAADEAACSQAQALTVLRANAADLLILKPALNGGLGASFAIARAARERNIEVLVTTALDGAVGAIGALHLAAALSCRRACGLATSSVFERDLAVTPAPQNGCIALPQTAGLGLEITPETLQRVATAPTQTRPLRARHP